LITGIDQPKACMERFHRTDIADAMFAKKQSLIGTGNID
jgi:hypothetical protein